MLLWTGVVLLLVGLTAGARTHCPDGCVCSTLHYHGTRAVCKFLDPALQKFPESLMHLRVEDCPKNEIALTKNFFSSKLLTPKLVSIRIANCSVVQVDVGAFDELKYLEDVDLSFNDIRQLDPNTIKSADSIKKLILRGNPHLNLDVTPVGLSQRTDDQYRFLISDSLVELILADSNIVSIPPRAFSSLRALEYLDLSGNLLTVIGKDTLASLANLEELNLAHNSISKIDRNAFIDIDDLTTLNVRGNPLKTLEGIEIGGLRELDASECNMEELFAYSFEGLPDLNLLNLSRNSIRYIDADTFTTLQSLRYLDLSNNNLRNPLSGFLFERNKQLETISLSGNKELQILEGFQGQFPLLYRIDLSSCGLTTVTARMFSNLYYVNSLNLSGNAIYNVEADSFEKLTHLLSLDLSNNRINELSPHIFKNNRALRRLYLGSNRFKHVPAIIFQSTPALTLLDLSRNHLAGLWNISESFVMRNKNILGRLSYLNVSGNKLKKLHMHSFISTGSLAKLDISNNPIECTPDFSHVMQWLIVNRVMPNKGSRPTAEDEDLLKYNIQWDDVIKSVCPNDDKTLNKDETSGIPNWAQPIQDVEMVPDIIRIPDLPLNSAIRNEGYSVEVEPLEAPKDSIWPMALVWLSMGAVGLTLLHLTITLLIRSRRRYTPVDFSAPFIAPTSNKILRTPASQSSQRSFYTKLYEECSAPAVHQPKPSRLQTIFRLPQNL